MYPVTVYVEPDGDIKPAGENETICWPPCCLTVALFAAAPFRNPHGVIQMFSACPQLPAACPAVIVWLSNPGIGTGPPGTDGGCVVPVARETRAVIVSGFAKLMARLYSAMVVALTVPIG